MLEPTCDVNGVATIPLNITAEVADIGDEFVATETVVLEALRQPNPTIAQFKAARKESAAMVAKLRQRVSRGMASLTKLGFNRISEKTV